MSKKVIFSSDDLGKALKKHALVVSEKMAKIVPSAKDIHIVVENGLATLTTTDLEIYLKTNVTAKTSGWPFELVLPFKYLQQIVSHAKEGSSIAIEHPGSRVARVIVDDGKEVRDTYEQKGLDNPNDFVKTPAEIKKKEVVLDQGFLHALALAQPAASNDELRPVLSRVCLDLSKDPCVVATNALIMYVQGVELGDESGDSKEQFLLSSKLPKLAAGSEVIEMHQSENWITVKAGETTVLMKKVEGKYPDYRVAIPERNPNLKVNRKDFIEALEKASINANTMLRAMIRLDEKGFVIVEMDNLDLACKNRIVIPGEYTGAVPRVAVNAKYMITVLNQVETEEVFLHITASNRAVLVTSEENPSYLGLIMPLHLD